MFWSVNFATFVQIWCILAKNYVRLVTQICKIVCVQTVHKKYTFYTGAPPNRWQNGAFLRIFFDKYCMSSAPVLHIFYIFFVFFCIFAFFLLFMLHDIQREVRRRHLTPRTILVKNDQKDHFVNFFGWFWIPKPGPSLQTGTCPDPVLGPLTPRRKV